MAQSFSSLRSDDRQRRSMYHCHHLNIRAMPAYYSVVGSRIGRHGESDMLAASDTDSLFDFCWQYVRLFLSRDNAVTVLDLAESCRLPGIP